MTKTRFQVYTDAETKRRIKLAAAEHGIAVTQYCTAYLALAQLRGCEFWTADERLYNAVTQELGWVNWLGNYRPGQNGEQVRG